MKPGKFQETRRQHLREAPPHRYQRKLEDISHRYLQEEDFARANLPDDQIDTDDQIRESIRICIPLSRTYGPLINIYNYDDCDCGLCNVCNEMELDDFIIYFNKRRISKGNWSCNNSILMHRPNNNNRYVNNSNYVNNNSTLKDNNIINCSRNNNSNNINTLNNSNNCKNNENNIKLHNVDEPIVRNLKYYFPIEDVGRYMRDGIIPQDCTFYRPNKDFCSIYLCDYLPLTNNTTMINDLTINDNTSKYNEKYKSKMKKNV